MQVVAAPGQYSYPNYPPPYKGDIAPNATHRHYTDADKLKIASFGL